MATAQFDTSYFDEDYFYSLVADTVLETLTAADIGPVKLKISSLDPITMPDQGRFKYIPGAWEEALALASADVSLIIPPAYAETLDSVEVILGLHSHTILETLDTLDCNTLLFNQGYFDQLYFDTDCVPISVTELRPPAVADTIAISDAIGTLKYKQTIYDTIAFQDLNSQVLASIIAEALPYTDSSPSIYFQVVPETLGLVDTETEKILDVIIETLQMSDTHRPLYLVRVLDSIALLDLGLVPLVATVSEDLGLTETFQGYVPIFVTDSLDLAESIKSRLEMAQTDTISLPDLFREVSPILVVESIGIPDTYTYHLSYTVRDNLLFASAVESDFFRTLILTGTLPQALTLNGAINGYLELDGIILK